MAPLRDRSSTPADDGQRGGSRSDSSTSAASQRRPRDLIGLIAVVIVLSSVKLLLSGRLLVNVTGSIPRGIYWISRGASPHRGELVALAIPPEVRDLLYGRGYVPRSISLLAKPVAAVGGDSVCIENTQLAINGEVLGKVLEMDLQGRPMPRHTICEALPANELFLATRHDNSFDSRYFGPVQRDRSIGTLTPLWTF